MAYFFYNTDANSLSRKGRYPVLIQHRFAASSGPYTFGEKLGRLTPGDDTLLMYENKVGIVAVGTVCEHWDRATHQPPIYYQPGSGGFEHEYRIGVHWFLDLSARPIGIDELRERVGYIPLGSLVRIVKHQAAIEQLIEERQAVG